MSTLISETLENKTLNRIKSEQECQRGGVDNVTVTCYMILRVMQLYIELIQILSNWSHIQNQRTIPVWPLILAQISIY